MDNDEDICEESDEEEEESDKQFVRNLSDDGKYISLFKIELFFIVVFIGGFYFVKILYFSWLFLIFL